MEDTLCEIGQLFCKSSFPKLTYAYENVHVCLEPPCNVVHDHHPECGVISSDKKKTRIFVYVTNRVMAKISLLTLHSKGQILIVDFNIFNVLH
jgi:hypothetical protein